MPKDRPKKRLRNQPVVRREVRPVVPETLQADEDASTPLRRLVAGLVSVEVLLLVAGVVFLVVGAISTPNSAALPATIFLVLIGVTIAVVLGFAALAVLGGERWSRGPIFTWQLLQAGVAMPITVGGTPELGAPMLAVAIVVGVLVAGRRVIVRRTGD